MVVSRNEVAVSSKTAAYKDSGHRSLPGMIKAGCANVFRTRRTR